MLIELHRTSLPLGFGAHLNKLFMMFVSLIPIHLPMMGRPWNKSTTSIKSERWKGTTTELFRWKKGHLHPSYTLRQGPHTTRYHKRFAELISLKRGEHYSNIINYMHTRIRFSILPSTLIAIRGERGKRPSSVIPFHATSFNLIPASLEYESF